MTGHSSGGYGALVLPMLRPDMFGALIAHAPDTLFEACYMSDFSRAVRVLRDHYDGSYEACSPTSAADTFDWGRWGEALEHLRDGRRVLAGSGPTRQGAAAVRHRAPAG